MASTLFDLKDKVAIVTGSCRGIGQAIAIGFAEAGANLALCCRYPEHLEATARQVEAKGRRWLAVGAEVSDGEQVNNLVQRILEAYGRIDILVNNVGGAHFISPVEETRERGWDRTFAVNLKSVFLCSQAVGRVMIKQGEGVIINVTSIDGRGPSPGMAPYGAAKAGVVSFTQTLAAEWARYNIRVNCIGPGLIATKLSEPLWKSEAHMEWAKQHLAMKRYGYAEEMVGVALFLASDASSYMTGETLYVSGGAHHIGLKEPSPEYLGFTGP